MNTCQWFESMEYPECRAPAPHSVTVKTKITTARVNLCDQHKAKHDENFARARQNKKWEKKADPSRK